MFWHQSAAVHLHGMRLFGQALDAHAVPGGNSRLSNGCGSPLLAFGCSRRSRTGS
jgi:hypothetical protein